MRCVGRESVMIGKIFAVVVVVAAATEAARIPRKREFGWKKCDNGVVQGAFFRNVKRQFRRYKCADGLTMNIPQGVDFKCSLVSTEYKWKGIRDRKILYNKITTENITCADVDRCPDPPLVSPNMIRTRTKRFQLDIPNIPDEYHTGDVVEYQCISGYLLTTKSNNTNDTYDDYSYYYSVDELNGTDRTLTCNKDGDWVGDLQQQTVTCEPILCDASLIAEFLVNGTILKHGTILNGTEMFRYLEELVIECDPGFRPINGLSSRICYDQNGFSDLTPEEFGCEEIRCPRLSNPLQGKVSYQERTVGSNATFECDRGRLVGKPVWTCQPNGQWDADCVICIEEGNQCYPPCIGVGTVMTTYPYSLTIGSQLEFTCKGDDAMYSGKSQKQTCLQNGLWDKLDIDCTGKTQFSSIYEMGNVIQSLENIRQNGTINETDGEVVGRAIDVLREGGVDVFLLFDVSRSIDKDMFDKMIKFAKALMPKLHVSDGRDGTRLAIYMFASKMYRMFVDHAKSEPELINTADAIAKLDQIDRTKLVNQTGQGTALGLALQDIHTEIMTKKLTPNDRRAQQVIILLSDGMYNMNGNPEPMANEIKETGAEIYSISIEKKSKRDHTAGRKIMEDIASDIEGETHWFNLDADDFDFVFQQMINSEYLDITCGVTNPGSTKLRNVSVADVTATRDAWPWMVQITRDDDHICGGSIIDKNWVLTAAHCFVGKEGRKQGDIKLYLMRYDLRSFDGVEERAIDQDDIFIHKEFNVGEGYAHDIALIWIDTVTFKHDRLLPVCLNDEDSIKNMGVNGLGQSGVVTGWGAESHNGKPVQFMKQIQMKVQNNADCLKNQKNAAKFNMTIMFCAGGLDTTSKKKIIVDSCKGDSGGPFIKELPLSNRFVQTGIVSSGDGCKESGKYGFYTKVSEYIPWIRKIITENKDKNRKRR